MSATSATAKDLDAALASCSISATPWFILLDAAQGSAGLESAADSDLSVQSLYAGDLGLSLGPVAPHLSTFEMGTPFSSWLYRHWDDAQCVLFQSKESFAKIRSHLRHFLMVKDQQGKKYRLRYYDARVLRAFLPVCNQAELTTFYGPIERFFMPSRSLSTVLAVTRGPRGLAVSQHPFAPAPPLDSASEEAEEQATGDLEVLLVDAKSGTPRTGASVQVKGPATRETVSASGGRAYFFGLPTGGYEVFGIDAGLNSGQAKVAINTGMNRVRVQCRPAVTAPTSA